MRTDRRGFLRLSAGGAALLLARGAGGAAAAGAESALGIHRATRNTRAGAIGGRLRAVLGELPPFKPYRGVERVALPAPSWQIARPLFEVARGAAPARAFAAGACSREELARLLFLANGVTQRGGRRALRAAPSAGALYAGEVYAVVERVSGIAPGTYYYDVRAHALVPLRAGSLLADVARAVDAPLDASRAALAVLLTNVFERYETRYANRGYRYALIDTGHIGENLRLAAGELGLAAAAPTRFEDDALNALLGVDGRDEAVCAVHLVGRPGERGGDGVASTRALVERQRAPAAAELAGGLSAPRRYHEATKLVAAGEGAAATAAGSSASEPAREQRAAAAGTDALPSPMPVHAAIRIRRSARVFETEPMQRAHLLAILALAQPGATPRESAGVDLYAVVHRVADTPAGAYRYDPASRALEPRRRGELAGPLVRASLGQRRTGDAAAALIGVAPIAEASARGGARSYRDLLLDAGATAQRIYLGAEALGLAARNLAAYYDDELDALLGLDGAREVAVHLTAIGAGD